MIPSILAWTLVSAHALAIWLAVGGWAGLTNGWPIWRDDHPLYFHSALVTKSFLAQSWTTAGYDPSFMAGYPKSVVFPASSTLPELVLAIFPSTRAAFAYKAYVVLSATLAPILIILAARRFATPSKASTSAEALLFLLYVWLDFPINYVGFGMLPYFLAVPLGLYALALTANWLETGGLRRYLGVTFALCLVFLVHLTSAMLLIPAVLASYAAAICSKSTPASPRMPLSRHLGFWSIGPIVLLCNAFWWWPGIWLASTKGASDFAFSHIEGAWPRLVQIVWTESPLEVVLLAFGLPGLGLLIRRKPINGWGLAGFIAAGFGWGYLAGESRRFDFLQPGRHTFAFYSGLAVASGESLRVGLARLRRNRDGDSAGARVRLDRRAILGLLLVGTRFLGPAVVEVVRMRLLGPEPFLSSRPSPRLHWVVEQVKANVKPGERLLYEEGGIPVPGVPEPFQGGRFSGLLPWLTGVEVIGGPYLKASLTTNFTQFGGGKLFERSGWDRDHFVKYARLYRPEAILCWTPHARGFCRSNPDLIQIVAESTDGTFILGKIQGFGGAAIAGSALVSSRPGQLTVRDARPGLDGFVVLRYHYVPRLRTKPAVELDGVLLEGDPVPFIRLRPPPDGCVIELVIPQGRGGRPKV